MLTTSRSARPMPGPALAGDVPAAGHVEHEDLRVDQRRGEGRGQVVAAGLDQHHVQRARSRARGPRRRAGSAVTSSRMAVCGQAPVSTAPDPLRVEHPGRAQEPGVLVGVDVVGDHADAAARRRVARHSSAISEVLPVPTGPATPSRRHAGVGWDWSGTEQPPGRCRRGASAQLLDPAVRGARGCRSGRLEVRDLRDHRRQPRQRRRRPSRGDGRVERPQLEGGRRDGLHVVVPDHPAPSAAASPAACGDRAEHHRPARPRRSAPAAGPTARRPAAAARGPASREVVAHRGDWPCARPSASYHGVEARSPRPQRGPGHARRWPPRPRHGREAERAGRPASSAGSRRRSAGSRPAGLGVRRRRAAGASASSRARSAVTCSEHRVELGQRQPGGRARASTSSPSMVMANVSGSMSMAGRASLLTISALPTSRVGVTADQLAARARARGQPGRRGPPARRRSPRRSAPSAAVQRRPHQHRLRGRDRRVRVAQRAPTTMPPPLITTLGRTPKNRGSQSTRSASLPDSTEPISWSMPCAIAGLIVYFAT